MPLQAAIYGLSGPSLTCDERDFFRDADPAGYILFRRNCVDREQMRALTDELRSLSGRDDLPITIDQEGGRVARMRPPEWPAFPSGEAFARLYAKAPMSAIEAARANAGGLALMLREVGVNVDLLPVLDVRQPGATDIVGDRALGGEPMQVAALGRAMLDGLHQNGVVGVVKHMPGHGRALVDSHHELPVVDAEEAALAVDIEPFAKLAGAPMGMVAHLVFTAWDRDNPASLSPFVIQEIIRGRIGFDGLLMTDDMGMKALSGGYDERTRRALDAGCDVALHCSGVMEEMVQVASQAGSLTGKSRERLDKAMAVIAGWSGDSDFASLIEKRDQLLAYG